jgi:hypothetical protein
MTINYKYDEGDLLREITEYINNTYGEHYAQGNIQSTEIAIDRGRGLGFCLGNVDKYSGRYGHKGTPEDWRKDLMKVIHYAKEQKTSIPDPFEKVNTKTYELKTSLSLSDTININPEYTIAPNWNEYNMGTTSLLTSVDTPGIIDLTETDSKKTKKKKD